LIHSGGSLWDWLIHVSLEGRLGVPIFFVISGYCIAASAESVRRGSHGTGSFFLRRFRRIYPPYWIVLAGTAVIVEVLPATWLPAQIPGGTLAPPQWAGAVTLTEEWRPLLGGPPKRHFLNHSWTLCYEEQFYAVVGVILLVARRWFYPSVAAVTALTYLNVTDLNALVGSRLGLDLNRFQFAAPGTFISGLWLAFAAGVAVYYWLTRATSFQKRMIAVVLLGGTAWAAQPLSGLLTNNATLSKCLVVAFLFAFVLLGLHRCDRRMSAARVFAPLQFCGRMCYSLYLVHAPLCWVLSWALYRNGLNSPAPTLLITLPVCLVTSVIAGYAFHRGVERHFLNSSRPKCTAPVETAPARPAEEAARKVGSGLIRLPA
jgi:peptidoglycan/LPS O-acetylase OafA/YrhL